MTPETLVTVATSAADGHDSAYVAFALAVILFAAKAGADLVVRIGQAAVLGELLAGVMIGNLDLVGVNIFEPIAHDAAVSTLANLGVIILLFQVGLESTVGQMLRVGWSALLVAVLGVVAPFALGWLVGMVLLPEAGSYAHAFIGATLSATSVGITARVLQDIGKMQTQEAKIILGAAVVDDVLGLVVLAVVTGMVGAADRGVDFSALSIAGTVAKSSGFLFGAIALGVWLAPRVMHLASKLRARNVLLATGLGFCFLLAWLSGVIGLAPIVGAFAAGLILEDVHYKDFVSRGEHGLEELIRPISSFLAPVFFVVMGARTDLSSFADPSTLGVAAALTLAAILGKQACSFGVLGKGVSRLAVGIGMIPRGEVGLIFANIGLTLTLGGRPIIDQRIFAAIVLMVIFTTFVTPPALRWSLMRARS
ncbi:MAG: cation:proton antiporter [Deltaproteobacteria bacterium]|nr:cation:proton antiporter [Deltaproteobacteria bacterium]